MNIIDPCPWRRGARKYPRAALACCCCFLSSLALAAPPPAAARDRNGERAAPDVELSLPEAVLLAVRDNLSLRNAYLGRIVDKFALWVAEGKFVPTASITASLRREVSRPLDRGFDLDTTSLTLEPSVVWKAPTGADFTFFWDAQGTRGRLGSWSSGNFGLRVTQPLLKGAGLDINRASVELARNNEQANVHRLRDTVAAAITQTILAYRTLMLARGRLDIDRRALEQARQLVATNRELIAAGRMARQDLIQAEADVATREVSLATSENALDAARLNLLELLDLDLATRIVPTEQIVIAEVKPEFERCLAIALERRPDYRAALLNRDNQALNVRLANNNSEWTLNLNAGTGVNTLGERWLDPNPGGPYGQDWYVGVDLIVPLFDRGLRQQRVDAEVAQRQAETGLEALRARIARELTDRIRDIAIKRRQIDLAAQSRALTQRQIEIEREKLNLGRSTNFQVVQFQSDLVRSQNAEISSISDYLDALTLLDQTLGTTLDTWRIGIETLPIPTEPSP